MAILTTDTSFFNAGGVGDPEVFKPTVGISRKVDFARAKMVAAASGAANCEFIALPAAFVITGLYVEELEKCTAAQITVKTRSDSATIGSAVTVGGATPLKSVQNVTAKVLAAGDILCLCISGGESGLTVDAGVLKVNVIGYLPDGDSRANFAITVPYRASDQVAGDNASKGDLLTR